MRENYSLTGHNTIMLRRLVRNAKVSLKSDLPPDEVQRLGFRAVDDLQDELDSICAELPADFRVAVAPTANVICAAVERGGEVVSDDR